MPTAEPAPQACPECLSTARRFAWLIHPWVNPVASNGSLPQQECWPAIIRELSGTGVGLVLRREFSAGAVVELHLHTQAGRVRCLPATVAEASPLDAPTFGRRWLLTCDFAEPLTPDELQALQEARADL